MTGLPRTATVETRHDDAAAAATVAAALSPDNTPEIRTDADGDVVRTRIERETTGGLHASTDDYLVNVAVADAVVATARRCEAVEGIDEDDGDELEDGIDTIEERGADDTDDISDTDDSNDTDDTNESNDTNTHE